MYQLTEVSGDAFKWTPRKHLIKGLILKGVRPSSLYALPGVGKGNFAIYLAVCLLNNLPVLGLESSKVEWVGYVDGEDDLAEFGRRVTRIARGLKVKRVRGPHDVEVPYRLDLRDQNYERLTGLFDRWAKLGENGLVIYDSAQALFGGNQATVMWAMRRTPR